MMPELLHDRVVNATVIEERYAAHAAPQSVAVYLADWIEAHRRLGRQIEALRALHDEKVMTWPT